MRGSSVYNKASVLQNFISVSPVVLALFNEKQDTHHLIFIIVEILRFVPGNNTIKHLNNYLVI